MNHKEKLKELKSLWFKFASIWDKPISEMQIQLFAEDLIDLPIDKISMAMYNSRRDVSLRSMPLPHQIRGMINPEPPARKTGIDAANRITKAKRKHGVNWTNGFYRGGEIYFEGSQGHDTREFKTWTDAARYELGDLGLEVVREKGGWVHVAEETGEESTIFAQLRDTGDMIYEKQKMGFDIHVPYDFHTINVDNHSAAALDQKPSETDAQNKIRNLTNFTKPMPKES